MYYDKLYIDSVAYIFECNSHFQNNIALFTKLGRGYSMDKQVFITTIPVYDDYFLFS